MGENKKEIGTSIDALLKDLRHDLNYQQAERLVSPFYKLAVDIINLRVRLGLTQKELAEKVGTFQSRISKIESGEHDIRLSTLIAIAEALGTQLVVKMIPIADVVYLNERPYTSAQNIPASIVGDSARFDTQGEVQSRAVSHTLVH